MRKFKMKNKQGFSLIETMVTMALFFVVLGTVYTMVLHYSDVSRTEHSRIRMEQESRFMMSNFTQEIQDAGAILTLANTSIFLGDEDKPPYFNGIYPLNQTDYSDGIIVAAGDPNAATFLTEPYSFAENGYFLTVDNNNALEYDASRTYDYKPWAAGDKAILLCDTGFYVFKVKAATPSVQGEAKLLTLEMRELPVYYSGLLNTYTNRTEDARTYTDLNTTEGFQTGNSVTYPKKSPVIRLTNFAIYLSQDITYPSASGDRTLRQLIRVTDTKGDPDVLNGTSIAEKSIISENIYDIQLSYRTYEDFDGTPIGTPLGDTTYPNDYYFANCSGSSTNADNLILDIRKRRLKQVDITIVSLSDDFGGKGEMDHAVPKIGDEAEYQLPDGKYSHRVYSLSIQPLNYNIFID
ncbi:MAG: prepilin-type N-terminal cleavage/methylation domain-containing protein [Acidobacteria bacterium]|jgi:prepilin-type N-terminal cleavage/methylation domain-containing protein|nr:prepilin-type N-terminal cleavage/methylation domain-containing protein [Acidobacteriota bacterium]